MSSSIEREAATQTQTLCSDAGFVFYLWVHPKPEKNSKSERNPKPQKTQNLKKPEKKPKKNPERNSFTKPDGYLNPTQNPMGSGAKFHPWV
jgi:hypothetical protein